MKAAIYNPYLDTLGGGEKYTAMVAKVFVKNGYNVDIEWSDKTINPKKLWQVNTKNENNPVGVKIKDFKKRFNLDLDLVGFVNDINRGDNYDLCFWVSDGSIPTLRSRKNILHFQVPFQNVDGRSLINKVKLMRIKKIVCNSQFTKQIIDEEYGVNSDVIYPPVDVEKIKPKRKENIILYVGRFSKLVQAKRQDVLISEFKKLYKKGYKDWKLVLAGGTEVGVGDYLNKLKKSTRKYPIEFFESPRYRELIALYGKSKIYWSAAGYGVDEIANPEKVEHFGITPVEAMAAGAVPIIFKAGGHNETVTDGESGFLWNSSDQLITKTVQLIEDPKLLKKLSENAKVRSKIFSHDQFIKKFTRLL